MKWASEFAIQIDQFGQRFLVIPEEQAREALAARELLQANKNPTKDVPKLNDPELGQKLAIARLNKRLEAKALANQLKISPVTLSNIEQSKNPPSRGTYAQLIKALFGVELTIEDIQPLPRKSRKRRNDT